MKIADRAIKNVTRYLTNYYEPLLVLVQLTAQMGSKPIAKTQQTAILGIKTNTQLTIETDNR